MKIILVCLVFVTVITYAQGKNNLPPYGVYKSANDYQTRHLTNAFTNKDSQHKLVDEPTQQVHVVSNDSTYRYRYDSIWGFRKKGEDWRVFNGRIYKIVYNGKACVYIRPTKTDYSLPGLTRFETTFFSATPGSPVYPLTQDNLLTVFSHDASLVKKVNSLRPSAPVTNKDKTSGLYEFITWL